MAKCQNLECRLLWSPSSFCCYCYLPLPLGSTECGPSTVVVCAILLFTNNIIAHKHGTYFRTASWALWWLHYASIIKPNKYVHKCKKWLQFILVNGGIHSFSENAKKMVKGDITQVMWCWVISPAVLTIYVSHKLCGRLKSRPFIIS